MSASTFTTPADEEFFASIGRFTISWAQLEFWIDVTVFILHYELNGRDIEVEIPWSLSRKLKYITRCFNSLAKNSSGFALLTASIQVLTKEIGEASDFRHDLLHGIALDHSEGTTTVKMTRFLRGRAPYERKKFEVNPTRIMKEAIIAMRLVGRTSTLAGGLRKLIDMAREERN